MPVKLQKFKYILLIALSLSTSLSNMYAQEFDSYKKELFIQNQDTLPYRILLPKDFQSTKVYPLILFLHGAGERGSDNTLQMKHGGDFFMSDSIRDKYPSIVVFPQCKTGMSWNNVEYDLEADDPKFIFPTKHSKNIHLDLLEGLIEALKKQYNIDKERMYVGGLSMGGMGTFELVKRNPRVFAAAFPICGGAHPQLARRLRRTSWWIFHGADDRVVPLISSEQIYQALKAKNTDVKLTVYPGVGHDSWTNAFAEPGLMKWLFSKTN
ncbi:MAG: dienelactone hydrolase family protein [Bacteroidia bacterium]|nr:dienelactone hydrolase family protein [Bacteroidia bacterium]NNK74229.1 phospholipase [Flavobacteriaceae bacterium]NNL79669.1 phospholipase [Flavobacteriaceae bacterium]